MRYQTYSVQDFVQDEYFQKWVITADESADVFWQAWLRKNPQKKAVVEEARHIILLMNFGKEHSTNKRFLKVWRELDAQWEKQVPQTYTTAPSKFQTWHKIAATLTGLLLLSTIYFFITREKSTVTYTTNFGETRTVLLPDSSLVTLNANSVLTMPKIWNPAKPRQVHLTGEAFFEVKKTKGTYNKRFIVHTANLNVEVLGTAFNVNHRRKKTRVVLNSGKIKLNTSETSTIDNMIMKPGELVEYSRATKISTIKQVNPAVYSSWKHYELIFDNTPVREIIQILEDTYGLQIQLKSKNLLNKKYTGTFKGADSDIILESLATLFGLEIDQTKDIIIIKDKE